jgi:predicted chitinase
MGNGDEASQEGYKFRGRGIIQLTGKNNYRKYTEIHNRANPNDQRDFVEDPDMIITVTRYGIESGFIYWAMVNANEIADSDRSADLTAAINGGMNGYADRIECLTKLKEHMGI